MSMFKMTKYSGVKALRSIIYCIFIFHFCNFLYIIVIKQHKTNIMQNNNTKEYTNITIHSAGTAGDQLKLL